MMDVRVVMPGGGRTVIDGGFGVVAKVAGSDTGGSVAIVEHPLAPGILGAPPRPTATSTKTRSRMSAKARSRS